jgi:micrococcal nuclease
MKLQRLMNWIPVIAIALAVGMNKPWESFSQASQSITQLQQEVITSDATQSTTMQLVPGSIYDGDTLRVRDGFQEIKIRLCGIDAPEIEQERGIASRDHLRSLINQGDGSVIVVPVETDRYGRLVAELFIQPRLELGYQPGEEIAINAQMVLDGYAHHYARYSARCPNGGILEALESEARSAGRGVWRNGNAVRPWEYRRSQR